VPVSAGALQVQNDLSVSTDSPRIRTRRNVQIKSPECAGEWEENEGHDGGASITTIREQGATPGKSGAFSGDEKESGNVSRD
jgi:hypothetical protein